MGPKSPSVEPRSIRESRALPQLPDSTRQIVGWFVVQTKNRTVQFDVPLLQEVEHAENLSSRTMPIILHWLSVVFKSFPQKLGKN
jgi:hypothetical protein